MPVEVGRRALAPVLQQESGGDDTPESTPLEMGGSGKRPPRGGAGRKQSSRTRGATDFIGGRAHRSRGRLVPCNCAVRTTSRTQELSLRVDENNDVTCDHLWADERVHIRSAKHAGNGMWIVDRNDIPVFLRQVCRPAAVRRGPSA